MKPIIVTAVAVVVTAAVFATAWALPSYAAPAPAKEAHLKLEPIVGSTAKRVTLSARAAERLGIATGKVGLQQITRKQMVGGLVVPPPGAQPDPQVPNHTPGGFWQMRSASDGSSKPPQADPAKEPGKEQAAITSKELWVQVTLSQPELERIAKDKPVRLMPLSTREQPATQVLARPSDLPPREDSKRSMLNVYYVISGVDHGLQANRRVRVELPLIGSDEKQKVVPYAALHYDAKGGAWVYVAQGPLVFERQKVGLQRIEGDLAVLSDGPPVGTPVVTTGASLLYGAEVFGK